MAPIADHGNVGHAHLARQDTTPLPTRRHRDPHLAAKAPPLGITPGPHAPVVQFWCRHRCGFSPTVGARSRWWTAASFRPPSPPSTNLGRSGRISPSRRCGYVNQKPWPDHRCSTWFGLNTATRLLAWEEHRPHWHDLAAFSHCTFVVTTNRPGDEVTAFAYLAAAAAARSGGGHPVIIAPLAADPPRRW